MAKQESQKGVFNQLFPIDVNEHTEKKKTGQNTELTYLSWAWAWAEVKKRYPDASYTIYKDEQNRPYIEDADFGLMCYTTVTIEGMTHEMWLPVMNGANKSMKRQPYAYKVWNSYKKQWEEKLVEAATMFDINKTIMRCLVKNLAMFGLGLYIYAGEDLPDTSDVDAPAAAAPTPQPAEPAPANKKQTKKNEAPQSLFNDDELAEAFLLIQPNIESAPSQAYLRDLYDQNPALQNYQPFKDAMNKRFKEVA